MLIQERQINVPDGQYKIDVSMEGGSGRASIESPTELQVENKTGVATITFSSPNYDYMIIEDETYLPVNTEGNSAFEIPVLKYDEGFEVIADTTAMSVPHEIEYTLCFDSSSITDENDTLVNITPEIADNSLGSIAFSKGYYKSVGYLGLFFIFVVAAIVIFHRKSSKNNLENKK